MSCSPLPNCIGSMRCTKHDPTYLSLYTSLERADQTRAHTLRVALLHACRRGAAHVGGAPAVASARQPAEGPHAHAHAAAAARAQGRGWSAHAAVAAHAPAESPAGCQARRGRDQAAAPGAGAAQHCAAPRTDHAAAGELLRHCQSCSCLSHMNCKLIYCFVETTVASYYIWHGHLWRKVVKQGCKLRQIITSAGCAADAGAGAAGPPASAAAGVRARCARPGGQGRHDSWAAPVFAVPSKVHQGPNVAVIKTCNS